MALNADTSEEVATSPRPRATLTFVYQEGTSAEKHYASIPASSNYKDALDSACECFEEYLPQNWETYIIELQHAIGEGRWAVIHPSVFSEIATRIVAQSGEIRLRIRPARNQSRHNTGNNDTTSSPTVSSGAVGQPISSASTTQDPPPYASVVAPRTLVVDNPEPPISDPRHDAFCDRCKHKIYGIRYKCSTCEDFDYCSVCIGFAPLEHSHRFAAIINREIRLFRPMDEWRTIEDSRVSGAELGAEHDATCDMCGASPIRGIRFKCAVCPDWDACQTCLERSLAVHPEHPFIRMADNTALLLRTTREVIPARTGLRCSVCQKDIFGPAFYQCKNPRCRLNHLCVHCEASPLSLACTHPLLKCRV
ncbi:hypothetical protein FRC08_000008 [Ceratobasidium sp. 394]|nr:hypothetical protein FRC08_000008 [Ceratobasidium sp. 394]